jgi:hypothetical protein
MMTSIDNDLSKMEMEFVSNLGSINNAGNTEAVIATRQSPAINIALPSKRLPCARAKSDNENGL